MERTRSAVMRAATDLVVEGGPGALTMDAVVLRSRVAKTTIYRHWKSRDDLLATVIEASVPRLPEPEPDADVETSLRVVMRYSVNSLRDTEWSRLLPAFIMLSRHEAEIRAINERMDWQHNRVLAELVQRAAAEGIVESGIDVDEAIAHLQGPLMIAFLAGLMPIDDRIADSIVDRFLAAFGPSAAAKPRTPAAGPGGDA
ncbi:TetR family transcriptional regulator [Pseudonocardia sulfidoxydans NBRC 16205]|uniref:TetR family transcriptional regulator n=1 Tax=Pseudonocardia sulfidoxydans NBRC 16205 TaxID=1223511 RepID=A0A511DAC4_9PSEU|nr:TetR family transcriptional regulator [Pseudonocardia sulfidoxydans NBRC 16205]